jgi:hypothetical protein
MRTTVAVFLVAMLVLGCGSPTATQPAATASPPGATVLPTATLTPTATAVPIGSPIVGSWHRAQTCEEMRVAFEAAGLAESHREWLGGNFFGGEPPPATGDVCDGAEGPLEHDHFFTVDGEFGSHDQNGDEVDGGDFAVVDDDTLTFPSHATEFGYDGDILVDYMIANDVATFVVVLPEPCIDACADAHAWALSAFASGPWAAGAVP